MDVDVIPFKIPYNRHHQVYVSGLRWDGIQEELEQELRRVFAAFGPIHRVVVRRGRLSDGVERDDVWYAYVTYFSTFDFQEVVQHSGRIVVGESRVKVKAAVDLREPREDTLPLYKSQELLGHYFGFNCWSSEIVHFERDTDEDLKDRVRYVCLVRVRMLREGLCSEGLGIGESPINMKSPKARGESIACAQRFAFNAAMKAAFGKFVIVRLRNGKVTVEVDTTQTDLEIYDPAWDKPEVEVINELDCEPLEEDSDDEFALLTDIGDEELEALLNASVSQEESRS